MNDHPHQLIDCAHCKQTGTCASGPSGSTCAACIKKHELKGKDYIGLACGTCHGLGKTDTLTYRMNNRTQPILAFSLVIASSVMLIGFGSANSPYFHEVMAFATTIIGTVCGFYFHSRQSNGDQ